MSRAGRYSTPAIVLHWLIAAAIVAQMVIAWRMHGPRSPETFAMVQLHKSVGITILLLSLARLGWRIAHPPPPLPETMPRWEKALAGATHAGFYAVMIGMPLTGWAMVSASLLGVPTVLFGAVPWPDLPVSGKAWEEAFETIHELGAKAVYGLLALHVAGALKHQLFSRDEPVLARMAPGAVAGRWWEPRLAAILAGAGAVLVLSFTLQPPRPQPVPASRPVVVEPAAPAPVAVATAAPPPAPPNNPVRWTIRPGSTLAFDTAWSGQAIAGRFERWDAEVLFSPETLDRSRVRVTVDLASADTGETERDAVLPGADWFDAAAHPRAVFTADRFEETGPDRYVARGRLTLRGVTRPLSLPFRLKIDGDTARVSGVTSLDRTAFGVGQGEWQATDQIPARVTIRIDLTARRR